MVSLDLFFEVILRTDIKELFLMAFSLTGYQLRRVCPNVPYLAFSCFLSTLMIPKTTSTPSLRLLFLPITPKYTNPLTFLTQATTSKSTSTA
jgi:hypothetical protein